MQKKQALRLRQCSSGVLILFGVEQTNLLALAQMVNARGSNSISLAQAGEDDDIVPEHFADLNIDKTPWKKD